MDVSPPTNLSNVSSSSKTTVSNTPSATSRADQSTSVTCHAKSGPPIFSSPRSKYIEIFGPPDTLFQFY